MISRLRVIVSGRVSRGVRARFPSLRIDVGLLLLGVLAVLALFPLMRALDAAEDRPKAMYQDVFRMEQAQMRQLVDGRRVVEVRLEDGVTTDVAGTAISTSEGVGLQVSRNDEGFCVRGWNEHGDDTGPRCYTLDDKDRVLRNNGFT